MLDAQSIRDAIPLALAAVDLPGLGPKHEGKVRAWYARDTTRILITTDRLSAFDRILGTVPYKGQVLNQLSAFWFEHTRDLVANHMLALPDPNVTVARECRPYPIEVIVRGYITGVTTTSLWYHYQRGTRDLYGARLPDGLRKNQALPAPLLTPTTKAAAGHDERLTPDEVVSHGYVPADEWDAIQRAALAVFARGQELARAAGLILVDTKYEFGQAPDGSLVLIDEVHTPDSSRFWRAASYADRFARGKEPENFDKEFIRMWYAERGYRGDGDPPAMPDDLVVQASQRYIALYEMLTGTRFAPAPYPAGPRIAAALAHAPDAPPPAQAPQPRAAQAAARPAQFLVPILMGSKADLPHAERIARALAGFGVPCEMRIASAHKSARYLLDLLAAYEADPRAKVYVTVAGRSNALSGLVDANVTAPVIACPPGNDAYGGADVFSSMRMPGGVAPALVLEPDNAALLAVKILALSSSALCARVAAAQNAARDKVVGDDRALSRPA